jgi:acyl-CoA synthetase (AMP-forming)/AMP-acid ligase II
VPGSQTWVLNEALEEVADGEWGELCVGGVGLARGYLHRPEQTAEKFVMHPRFGRIYRTGDLVHRAADGNLFYHGRADTQVKIRGYRIELEEIEMRLAEWQGVRSAACAVQDGVRWRRSWCRKTAGGWDSRSWKRACGNRCRITWCPAGSRRCANCRSRRAESWIARRCRACGAGAREPSGMAPRNAREIQLAEASAQVLGLDAPVPVDADFFTDLGGNSLRAAQLVTGCGKKTRRRR